MTNFTVSLVWGQISDLGYDTLNEHNHCYFFIFFGGGGGGGGVSTIKLFIIRINSPALDYTDDIFAIQIMTDFCIAGH